jgi:4-alpha-glucanotransferase
MPLAPPTSDPMVGPSSGPLATRRAGVLLHVTSLPSAGPEPGAPGDLGAAAYRFVDFLHAAGCTVWQVLPLVPKHQVNPSPYNAISALAGDAELVSLSLLHDQGLLSEADLEEVADGTTSRGEARVRAAERFLAAGPDPVFEAWCAGHPWLEPYVQFVALRESRGCTEWSTWEPALRRRDPDAVRQALAPLAGRLDVLRVEQWFFASQWAELKQYAAQRDVAVFGDLPIFVSLDSADVWGAQHLWRLDEDGKPITVTGVPPDYFAAEGQRWNNPHYDWDAMAAEDFGWWRRRVAGQRELFDLVRIDHFRGFEAAWHVPVEAETAKEGHWEKSPGREVLAALLETSGEGTLVAEDLGVITPEVDRLRLEFGLPGMKVLQFAFDGDPDNFYLLEHHVPNSVVYTGTHDNDTTVGWWRSLDEHARRYVLDHIPAADEPMPWALIQAALGSVGRLAVVPAQDLLGLGSEARMNTPGTAAGNWSWQAEDGVFDEALASRLRALVERSGRLHLRAPSPGPSAPGD